MIDIAKLNRAIKHKEDKKAGMLRCPECGKPSALLTLSFRNLRIASLCRFCEHVQYAKGAEEALKATDGKGAVVRPIRKMGV